MTNKQLWSDMLRPYPLYRESRIALWALLFVYGAMTLATVVTFIHGAHGGVLLFVVSTVAAFGFPLTALALFFGRFTAGRMPLPEERDEGILVTGLDMIKILMSNERLPNMAALPLCMALALSLCYSLAAPVLSLLMRTFFN